MARIRSIKPEFWDDEHISLLPMGCRLFYIGCWTFADDQGVFNANPSFLKSRIFPYDDDLSIGQVKEWLSLLEDAKMIIPFCHERGSYYVIRTFGEHQNIDKRYFKRIVPEKVIMGVLGIKQEQTQDTQETTQGTHSGHDGCSAQDRIIIVNRIGEDSNVIVNGGVTAEEQEEFYICMFFRNMKQPRYEAERFVLYNNGKRWRSENGCEWKTLEEKMSLAASWRPNEQGNRCHENFLAMWRELFYAIRKSNPDVARLMIDEKAKGGFDANGAVIYCNRTVVDFLNSNYAVLSPIISKWSLGYNITYHMT